jgi:exopolysaccharide production protein ExoY
MSDEFLSFQFNQRANVFRLRRWWVPPSLYPAVKRAFDFVAVVAILPIALAIVAVLAFLVRRDGGDAFFIQPRIGKDGRVFRMWKLRTMVPLAEDRLESHLSENPAARDEWDRTQKLTFDPRITRVGHYLRRYSLDELPQLVNVLIGDMSLVGPRPICLHQKENYPGSEYFWLRPGMTGLWQVSARNACSFAERATYDSRYAAMISFATDMRILWQTVFVVFRGTGV